MKGEDFRSLIMWSSAHQSYVVVPPLSCDVWCWSCIP